ncbi:tautomerase family protein [Fundicoccus culcitae]|uniref:4-oxalocrotonate tautomerase family protein n=1 Tax=Fundicoccus culcitae TaxID=2969821 RepID=A0ABY5P6L1_9LACT|nr:tautomerase family protein [Fundicoccus culcitae]UUX34216.1 4-oxalocrotonate tautomerase family protein [Fundicoccus culcitae]
MPFVRIQLKEGRTPRQKEALAKGIIVLMEEQKFADSKAIKVIFEDMAPEDFYDGQTME